MTEVPAAPAAPAWEGPEWVADKYRGAEKPIEAQAQAYSEAMKKLAMKTEDLRSGIETETREKLTAEVQAEWEKTRGAPETADAYAYPEGYEAPAGEIDGAFRGWAKKHALSQDAFNEAVDLFGQTQINPEAERTKLGPNVDARITAMNEWGSKAIPPELHAAAQKMMSTAEGVEVFEHFMNAGRDAGYSPAGGTPPQALTPAQIRAKQNDPRYWDPARRDPAFVAEVQKDWQVFGARADAQKR